ncbi:hypothetical protein, partial [Altererythrobacter sp.]|uniref:hypothetical protein n=1 Tax=Altererythrobacter sp. TaxID=1872480 RepID=UPI003D091BFC
NADRPDQDCQDYTECSVPPRRALSDPVGKVAFSAFNIGQRGFGFIDIHSESPNFPYWKVIGITFQIGK